MRHGKWKRFFLALPVVFMGAGLIGGCDDGKNTVDEVTGNRAVKQYHESKKEIEKIVDRQAERYKSLSDEDREDNEKE